MIETIQQREIIIQIQNRGKLRITLKIKKANIKIMFIRSGTTQKNNPINKDLPGSMTMKIGYMTSLKDKQYNQPQT